MSQTHTPNLPLELEFDPDNYGSCRPSYGLLADGRGSRINIEGSEDTTHALEREVVKRWNAHDDLVAALQGCAQVLRESAKQFRSLEDHPGHAGIADHFATLAEAELAKAGEK